jgi:hypothetical protein
VPLGGGGLLSRLWRTPALSARDAAELPCGLADDLIAALEARAMWARFGL